MINTEEPATSWRSFALGDLDIQLPECWRNHDIWICDECLQNATNYFGVGIDEESGEYYDDSEIDFDKLSEMVEKALRRGDEK